NEGSQATYTDLGTINMRSDGIDLETVTVTAKIPPFEQTQNGTINVNVQKTMLASSNNVMDVLAKSPTVMVSSGVVSIVGKGEAILLLNGKQTNAQQLASIPVSQIEKIEIISNPSAKYDASGNAVINVITIVNEAEGFQGTLMENAVFGRYFLNIASLNLNYRTGKLSLTADYGSTLGTDWVTGTYDRIMNDEGQELRSTLQTDEEYDVRNLSTYRFGLGYAISPKSSISLQYDGLYKRMDLSHDSRNVSTTTEDNSILLIEALNNGTTENVNNSVSLNYNLVTDSLGSSLFVGGQFSRFNTNSLDLISEDISFDESIITSALRRNDNRNEFGLYFGQVDYVKQLKSGARVEVGLKHAYVNSDGRIDFSSKQDGSEEFVDFPELSNGFLYDEHVSAAYAQYTGSIKDMGFSAGLRVENSTIDGFSRRLDRKVIDTTYINFFPSASLNGAFNENWSWALTFSSRINRPVYQNLDPFVVYFDSLSSRQGNPSLVPEMAQSVEGILAYKGYSLKLGYTNERNAFRSVVQQGGNSARAVFSSVQNLEVLNSYFANLSIPINYKFWSSFNTITTTLFRVNDDRPDFQRSVGLRPQFYFYTINQFNINNLFMFELGGEYNSGESNGVFVTKPEYSMNMGVSKSFLEGKLMCRLTYNDAFRLYRPRGEQQIGNVFSSYDNRLNTHFLLVSVTYSFGKLKEVSYSNKAVGEDGIQRVKN
ncbi:MAG: outer membrane beta-barrel protein, partial [Bacteroidota bacterium]